MRRRYSFPVLATNAARAALLLLHARLLLSRLGPKDVIELNRRSSSEVRGIAGSRAREECERAAFFIGRMARRVPWRADCLVQAIAGRNWLARKGIAAHISVGAARGQDGALEAHAWLVQGGEVVLGGDVSRFEVLLEPDAAPVDPQR